MEQQDTTQDELPLQLAGEKLRRAREAKGLSREDIAASTKIAERHLVAIEEGRFCDLASRTYAVGFARAYARAVDLDERTIAEDVRQQLEQEESAKPAPQHETFEPGDPARVPPPRLAWVAGVAVVVGIILLGVYWRGFQAPEAELPDLVQVQEDQSASPPEPAASPSAQPAAAGPVVFTAVEPGVWVKFYDANGNQLFQKQMAQGERYTVPADAQGPQVWTARPDALDITVGGKPVPRLAESPVTMKDIPVTAQALIARGRGAAPPLVAEPPAAAATTAAARPAPREGPAMPLAEERPAPRTTPPAEREPQRRAEPAPAPAARETPAPQRSDPPVPVATETVSPVSAEQRISRPVVQPIPTQTDPPSTDSE